MDVLDIIVATVRKVFDEDILIDFVDTSKRDIVGTRVAEVRNRSVLELDNAMAYSTLYLNA